MSKIVVLIFCLLSLPVFASGTSLSEEEKLDLFSQAKEFFRKGNESASRRSPSEAKDFFTKAVMRFERIVRDGGVQNGKLYYNIGNTYFRMGDIGKAILNYRRAERFIQNDPNLHQNLEYAFSKRPDRIEEKNQTKVLKTLLFWHYDFSSGTRSVIFIICFTVFWIGACIRIFTKKLIPRLVLVCAGIFAAIFLSSLLAETILGAENRIGVVLSEKVIARKGDGKNYQPSFKEPLHAGIEFKLIEDRNDWYQIELGDGRRCWINKKEAAIIE